MDPLGKAQAGDSRQLILQPMASTETIVGWDPNHRDHPKAGFLSYPKDLGPSNGRF